MKDITLPHKVRIWNFYTPRKEVGREVWHIPKHRSPHGKREPLAKKESSVRTWSFIFLFSFMAVGIAGLPVTGAYFSDTEGSNENTFNAQLLDIELASGEWSLPLCSLDEPTIKTLELFANSDLSFTYSVEAVVTGGDPAFCSLLELTARRNGVEEYSGLLVNLFLMTLEFQDPADTWEFEIIPMSGSLPDEVDGMLCDFDLVFDAALENFVYGEAFYDREIDSNSIMGVAPGGGGGLGDVVVENGNEATVINIVNSSSNTGGNTVGSGGTITTGDANSSSTVVNVVNTNETDISGCGCGCESCGCSSCENDEDHHERSERKERAPRDRGED